MLTWPAPVCFLATRGQFGVKGVLQTVFQYHYNVMSEDEMVVFKCKLYGLTYG